MDNFKTVYIFTQDANSLMAKNQFDVFLGIIIFAIGIGLIVSVIRKQSVAMFGKYADRVLPAGMFAILWAVIWSGWSLFTLNDYNQRYDMFVEVYDTQQYKTSEGTIKVISVQPDGGHTPGDMIQIGGVELEVNGYSGDFGYSKSIVHQGILTEGKYVKVFYYDGRILRIDVKQ